MPGLTPDVIEYWKTRGLNQNQIAEVTGFDPSYVSKVKKREPNYSRTPQDIVRENFPFEYPYGTATTYNAAAPNKRLRDHSLFMATGGRGMSRDRLRRLRSFYEFLIQNNAVVEFDPRIPPSRGIKTGGFAFPKRRDSDGDLIIRRNKFTKPLTDQGLMLWRMPPQLPQVS